MVVNLNDPTLTRTLVVDIILEAHPDHVKEVKDALTRQRPLVKSEVIRLLADKRVEDVRGSANIVRLRRDILLTLNQLLFPGQDDWIKQVSFYEFNVQ